MKTMNVLKKVFISCIVLTMVMAFSFGFNVIVKAAPAIGFIDGLNIEGAGIRTNGNQGMRFKVTIDSSVDKTDITSYGVAIAYGLVEDPSEFFYNQKVNGKDIISGEVTQLDGDNCYYITLYNIPQTGYMQNISVRAFCSDYNGYIYGNDIKVYNLTTVAYKAMNDGITSSLLTDVDTYMNANYKKVYVDEFDNLVFDGFKETNPKELEKIFINDINQYLETKLTTNSSVNDWVFYLKSNNGTGLSNKDITDSKLYQAFNNTKFNNKWSWLLTYLEAKNNADVSTQINGLNNNNPAGTSYYNLKNLIYSLYNFFNCEASNSSDSIVFNTASSYDDLSTSNIYPEIEDYEIKKVGTTSALGHKIEIAGYTCNWLLDDTSYTSTDNYTITSGNVKFMFNKICHVTYTISSKVATVTGLNTSLNITDLVIPSKCEGCSVTTIKANAFKNNTTLTSVTIPASVTSIGSLIFENCTNLTSITVASNNNVFDSRDNCNAIIVTSSNTLSYGCKNTTIPNTVKNIAGSAFSKCTGLTTITIPNSVTSIGGSAFNGCTGLTSISIPDSVTNIGASAFDGCTNLQYNEYDNAYYLGNETNNYSALVKAKNTNITSCDVNETTKVICANAFNSNTKLATITIANGVTNIGSKAFYNCTSLTSVTVPNSVDKIESNTFYGCSGLINVTIGDNVTSIGERTFYNCTSLESITMPNDITSIGTYAFNNCSSLQNITIPSSVTKIENYTFNGCSSLTSVTMPNGITSIGSHAFDNCAKLTDITFPDNLTTIGTYAFNNCLALSTVTIPNKVKNISDSAFYSCTALKSITISDSVTSIGNSTFYNCVSLESIIVGSNNTKYDSRNNCNAIIEKSSNTLLLGCKNTIIPNTVETIGYSAFVNCTGLTTITIPTGVKTIGNTAFSGCANLETVTIQNGLLSIGQSAFYQCKSLSTISIPNTVTNIGGSAFYQCTSLESIIIPSTVTTMGSNAFYGCASLTINCEVASIPSGWNSSWNSSNRPVNWGYTIEEN